MLPFLCTVKKPVRGIFSELQRLQYIFRVNEVVEPDLSALAQHHMGVPAVEAVFCLHPQDKLAIGDAVASSSGRALPMAMMKSSRSSRGHYRVQPFIRSTRMVGYSSRKSPSSRGFWETVISASSTTFPKIVIETRV
jgi:hypothetical protein